jgi:PAS domain S-box-containing protein
MVIGEVHKIGQSEEKTQYFECRGEIEQLFDALMERAAEGYHKSEKKQRAMPMNAKLSSAPPDPAYSLTNHQLNQLIFQSNNCACLLVDLDLSVVEVNKTFTEMFNLPRDQLIGQPIDKIMPIHPSKRFVQWVLERGKVGHYVTVINDLWVTVSTSMIYHDGVLQGAMAVFVKLTDINIYEESMTKQEALASVGQLAAGMAHEIRNPLTSIKGFIQLLKEQDTQRERDSYYSVILMEIERIDGLLNDVLVLARYRDENVSSRPFRVVDEVMGVVRLLEPEANRRGIKVELQVAQGEWYVHGYSARIKQAILNIMKNAFEAIHAKGKIVRVSVAATASEVIITIEDDGPGLSEEIQQKLFVPFYTTKPEGTGLGLSTTLRIIADHHGVIFADNSPHLGGARFEVRLPLASQ